MNSSGTPRYIKNIISWLAAHEKHIREDGFQDGSDFKPIVVNYEINDKDKWDKFKPKPIEVKRIEEMKTLLMLIVLVLQVINQNIIQKSRISKSLL